MWWGSDDGRERIVRGRGGGSCIKFKRGSFLPNSTYSRDINFFQYSLVASPRSERLFSCNRGCGKGYVREKEVRDKRLP